MNVNKILSDEYFGAHVMNLSGSYFSSLSDSSYLIDDSGTLISCGYNYYGELGHNVMAIMNQVSWVKGKREGYQVHLDKWSFLQMLVVCSVLFHHHSLVKTSHNLLVGTTSFLHCLNMVIYFLVVPIIMVNLEMVNLMVEMQLSIR